MRKRAQWRCVTASRATHGAPPGKHQHAHRQTAYTRRLYRGVLTYRTCVALHVFCLTLLRGDRWVGAGENPLSLRGIFPPSSIYGATKGNIMSKNGWFSACGYCRGCGAGYPEHCEDRRPARVSKSECCACSPWCQHEGGPCMACSECVTA